MKQYEDLIDQHYTLIARNGRANIKSSDIIMLNLGGMEMFIHRDNLTTIKGSRLEALSVPGERI